ncbi:heme o synthase [Aquibacillus rhizosphaerae]|uniref:Protoheme IX farnesyltransferase n=1 Tax=Aquibacillus rhizosphaerae TaxID=3051431 RepID=A0ABT7L9X3_9BACI|nr:heme o synthase [Aquibacillus sp. LR5S19]MDL4842670.1 heme o synthase [Aquibacillus sp. LR5S19]
MKRFLANTTVKSNQKNTSIIADLKALFKAVVLISNVLPVFAGFWLALYFTNTSFMDYWQVFLLTIIGSTCIMAGALLLNNWYDVDIDSVMKRTQNRPTVTGTISLQLVFLMGVSFSVVGFILLLFVSLEAGLYALIGWVTYVFLYTMWSKRRYASNTLIGSLSGAVTPLIGWAAIAPVTHIVPITLFLLLFIWQMPHTFAIAMKKHDEYKAAKVAMLPVVQGFQVTKRHMLLYILCLFPLPFFLGSLGVPFLIVATLLNIGWLMVAIRGFFTKDDLKWANRMFIFSLNYLMIMLVMMIIVATF